MNMQVGPLHAAVPLEGTDTVTGLLELERRAMRMQTQMAASTAAQCRDNIVSSPVPRCFTSRVGRDYGGPHCWDLTSSALFTPPLPWQLYFGSEANLLASYNIPYDLKHLNQRLDENMTKYLSNHVRVAGILFVLVLYMHPKAFVGTGLLIAIGLTNLHIEQTAVHPVSEQLQMMQSCSGVLAVAAAFWGSTVMVLLESLIYSAITILVHSSFRIAASETVSNGAPVEDSHGRHRHADPGCVLREIWQAGYPWCEYATREVISWVRNQARALQLCTRETLGVPQRRWRSPDRHTYVH